MDSTYRWYRLRMTGNPITPADLRRKLLRSGTDDAWFANSENFSNGIRFFRKSNLSIEKYDSNGALSLHTVEAVSSTEILIAEGKTCTVLRVQSPGRSMRPLFAFLEKTFGYGFSVAPVTFDKEPAQVFHEADVKRLVSLKVTDVALRPNCVARMEFVSREGLDLKSISFLQGISYRKDFTKYELVYNGLRGNLSFSVSGLIKVSGAASELIMGLLEQEVLSAS